MTKWGLDAQQTESATSLTVAQAVENALRNYPSIHVSQEQLNASSAAIQLARTAYLPKVDAFAQINRATRNNVFGLVLPQTPVPAISGPVLGTNNLGTAWGSAAGVLVTWEPFDFGLRHANVATAATAKRYSETVEKRTQFEVSAATADAYLTLAAAQETVRAAQAAVDRSETLTRITKALVDAQLRPGADASRAEAELASSRTQLIQAHQAIDVARATLAQFVGEEPNQIAIAAPGLRELPPTQGSSEQSSRLDPSLHPFSIEQNAVVEQAKAQLRILERSYFPRFYLQGAAYARGTGAETDGRLLGGLNGLGPNVQNYAVGFSVTFPLFDFASIHAREAGQSSTVRAETARYQQIVTDLKAQWNRAVATLEGFRKVAENTPIQVSAARATTTQATARYQSGLGNVVEVAEAQRLLTQAEIDDALARLGVWRALLGVATAAGDIRPFLAEASR